MWSAFHRPLPRPPLQRCRPKCRHGEFDPQRHRARRRNVISQNPVGWMPVYHPLRQMDIEVSLGPAPVTVPDVVGLSQAAAQTAITTAGLNVGTISSSHSDTVPAGNVISQNPGCRCQCAARFGGRYRSIPRTGSGDRTQCGRPCTGICCKQPLRVPAWVSVHGELGPQRHRTCRKRHQSESRLLVPVCRPLRRWISKYPSDRLRLLCPM